MLFYRVCGLVFAMLLCLPLAANPLPARAYGQLPQISSVKLSPDGLKLGLLQNLEGQTVLGVNDLATNKATAVLVTDNVKFKIRWFVWANDQILLTSADFPAVRYGVDTMETRLLKIDIRNPTKMELMVKPRERAWLGDREEHVSQLQDQIVSLLPNDDEHMLLEMDLDAQNLPSVYKVELASGKKTRVRSAMGYVHEWLADQQGRVRLGVARDETKIFFRLFDLAKQEWRTIWEYEIFDAPDITPLGFGLDPNQLYIRALHNKRYAIFRVDVASPDLKRELVYADAAYDVEGQLIYSPRTGDVIGVWHGEAEDSRIYWDADYVALQGYLDKTWPDADNAIVNASRDEGRFIVHTMSATNAGSYYLLDLKNQALGFIAAEYPLLKDVKLASKRKVQYTARDGQLIEAYVTTPANTKADAVLPAVVLPHGGPMVRDYAWFDWLVEFIASRGYVVMQPNFRGSSGYGYDFEMQSVRNWGGTMQDDLEDAARWLVQQKFTKDDSICIVGASYGGYAALMAAATQQKTFRCAASFAGVTDLAELVAHSRYYTHGDVVEKQLGTERALLKQKSPRHQAQNIGIPVLVIHGDKDRVVPVLHGRDMRDALKKYKKDYRYVELENGDHNLRVEAHRIKLLELLDDFLAANLKR